MSTTDWWRSAVIYEAYIRSFADGNGDGDVDVEGLRSRLPYLRDLGVDAIWITPWYPSPMADGGYDVADYRAIQPMFGSLPQARALLDEAHAHDLKVIIDLVPNHPHWDRDEVHDIYRSWRQMIDDHPAGATFVAEAWVANPHQLARYVRPDELHSAFNFDFLRCSWHPERLRDVIDSSMSALHEVGAPATWVLSNHDVTRHVTRYGRPHASGHGPRTQSTEPVNLELGLHRARAAALLMLTLPGSAYLYQGEELGLGEVDDLPDHLLQDPTWERSGHTVRGRDGCRVPLPWSGDTPPFGFSPAPTARPWLPQPAAWKDYTVESQTGDPHSMLELYRSALHIRRTHPALGDGTLRWLPSPPGTLTFARDPGFVCAVNLSATPIDLPPDTEPLLVSAPLDRSRLPADAAAWLTTESSVTPLPGKARLRRRR